ncbi:uncharacterized protein [Diadema antillarum]|uniref:uncharacterized protein n=1 Tax=Diadema antillarum TaxID=105358 RepID=UPI003A845BF4
MDEEQGVSIDDIKLWTVGRLRDFLKERNLKVSRRKDELVALVYAAKTMPHLVPAPARPSTESKSEKYEDLLRLRAEESLPDPNTLTGWISEVKSLPQWPPTMSFDIGEYLRSIDNVDLRQRLMADYKDGKGYSYFESGWVKEVEFHPISENSEFCFLRTECRPSQRIRNIPWKVWVAIGKSSGTVKSAYCTCFAG